MRAAGLRSWRAPSPPSPTLARPGVSTGRAGRAGRADHPRRAAPCPSFKGYHGYPASICASVNEQIVHGIPAAAQVLADGDLISIDCGAILDGWHGDAAVTIAVGAVSDGRAQAALGGLRGRAARRHRRGACRAGGCRDISYAMQTAIAARGRARRRRVRHRRRVRRARHRHLDAHGPVPAQPRQARPGPAAACRAWRWPIEPMLTAGDPSTGGAGRRLDRGHAPTAPARRTGSTRWRSPTTARVLTLPAADRRCPFGQVPDRTGRTVGQRCDAHPFTAPERPLSTISVHDGANAASRGRYTIIRV